MQTNLTTIFYAFQNIILPINNFQNQNYQSLLAIEWACNLPISFCLSIIIL